MPSAVTTLALVAGLVGMTACGTSPPGPAGATPGSAATTAAAPAPAKSAEDEAASRAAVASLIGTTPPAWQAERWINSAPLDYTQLRGSVLLVRWWTAGCPFCSTTAPALRTFAETYGPRGLRVIGMYHHKEETPFDPAVYEATAKKYGFTFPIAFDPGWKTLESWLRDKDGNPVSTGWTSVTFLVDKHGVIRHVHPGGSYVKGEPSYDAMTAAIEQLLSE